MKGGGGKQTLPPHLYAEKREGGRIKISVIVP